MKTTTIGSYPKPSYLKIPDWFQNIDNTPIDWERAWKLLGNQKEELIKKASQEVIREQENSWYRHYNGWRKFEEKITFFITVDI